MRTGHSCEVVLVSLVVILVPVVVLVMNYRAEGQSLATAKNPALGDWEDTLDFRCAVLRRTGQYAYILQGLNLSTAVSVAAQDEQLALWL